MTERTQSILTRALIVTLWTAAVVPRLLQSLTSPKYRVSVLGTAIPYSSVARLADKGLQLLSLALLVTVIVLHLRQIPKRGGLTVLLLLAPWLYAVSRDLLAMGVPGASYLMTALLFPLVVIAMWLLQPRLTDLAPLGWLTAAMALLSMAMAVILPSKGLYHAAPGELVSSEKEILPLGLLIGPLTHENSLGLFLALGLPAVALLSRRWLRAAAGLVVLMALVWTASRSSLAAAATCLTLAAILNALPRRFASQVSGIALSALIVTAAALPFVVTSDTALTNRGYIWRMSLQGWADSPIAGHGSRWYDSVASYANNIAGSAFQGHNAIVQALVTGGVIGAVLLMILLLTLTVTAVRHVALGSHVSTMFGAALLVTSTLEVSFGYVDRDLFLPVAVVPLALFVQCHVDSVAGRTAGTRGDPAASPDPSTTERVAEAVPG